MALPAVRHLDPVIGVDVHSVVIAPEPVPVPLPHPHVGFVLDLREYVNAALGVIGSIVFTFVEERVTDYLEDHPDTARQLTDTLDHAGKELASVQQKLMSNSLIAGAAALDEKEGAVANALGAGVGMGSTRGRPIFVNGLLRATAGTHTFHVPGLHFPLGEAFGAPDPKPSNDAESYMGSRTVVANNDPMSFMALPAMSCWSVGLEPPAHNGAHTTRTHLSMPTSVMLPIPAGRPVLVGGPPVMNMFAFGSALFRAFRGSAFARKLADKLHLKSGFLRCKVLEAEPVDVTTGEVIVQQQDFTVYGRLPLVWARCYASRCTYAGSFGTGWQTPADIRLELMRHEEAVGAAAYFPDHATAFDTLPDGIGWDSRVYDWQNGYALYRLENRLVLRTRKGIEYGFALPESCQRTVDLRNCVEPLELLIDRMADLYGNAWVFERQPDRTLTRVVEWKRDVVTKRVIECGTGRGPRAGLRKALNLIDADGRAHSLVSYELSPERNLTAVSDANAQPYCFEYANGHLMVRHTSPRGDSFYYHHQYDNGVWQVDRAWGDNGVLDYRFAYDRARREVRITDSLAHMTVMQLNERDMPVARIDPLGGVSGYSYDAWGHTSSEIDPTGRITRWQYDACGNLLAQTLPDGSRVQLEYDGEQRPVCMTVPGGRQWRLEWNAQVRLLGQTSPAQATSHYAYDAHGQLISHTGPRGAVTRFDYDCDGNLERVTDALNHRHQYVHDARGNLIQAIDPLGQTSCYEYDHNLRLTRAIEPDGREVHCGYDADGNLIRYRDPAGNVTQMEYTSPGQICRLLTPDGNVVEYRYDTEAQLVGVINECGQLYELRRDALGRIVEEIDYWGQPRRYDYGAAGELLCSSDALGQTIRYVYDALGRLVRKNVPDAQQPGGIRVDALTYDRSGNLIRAENPDSVVEMRYDAEGRIVEEKQGDAFTIFSSYDATGNRTERRTRLLAGGETVEHTVRYSYDSRDDVKSIQIDDAAPVVFERDPLRQVRVEYIGAELRHEISYTTGGQLATQTLLSGTGALFAHEYTYDPNGELSGKRDLRGNIERFQYDPVGRLTAHLDPTDTLHPFLRSPAGDLLRTRIRERGAANTWHRDGEYDGCFYAFDRAGNMVRKQDAEQDLTLRWDGAGQLADVQVIRPATDGTAGGVVRVQTHYAYDAFNRRVRKTVHAGHGTNPFASGHADSSFSLSHASRFFWDGDTLVGESTTDHDGRHAPQPSLSGRAWAGAGPGSRVCHAREWVYYPGTLRPLAAMYCDLSAEPTEMQAARGLGKGVAAVYFFQTDPNGAPVRMHDRDGNIAWAARFGATGCVDSIEVERVQQPIRLQGQYFDHESNLHYNRHRYFDPSIGQFISEDPLGLVGGLNPFSYGPNVLAWIDPLGLESLLRFANRLRSAGKTSGAVSFLSIGTTTFKGVSGNVRPADYHPQLRRVLDEIKHSHVVEDWHGYCAEVDAINKALKAGYSLNGATIKTLNVTVDKRHGKVKAVCKTCEPLTEFFGIIPEYPPVE